METYIEDEYCPTCGCDLFDVEEQIFKNGKTHLRATCNNCKRFIKYLSQNNEAEFRMPFGMHKGKPLADIPRDYLDWLLENGKNNIRNKIKKFYETTI
jgi:hypothetical protein